MPVLDDQMDSENMKGNTLCKFLTQGSHHRNLTVLYIVQNIFNQDKSMRTVSLNSHYLVLFKKPRDMTQIRKLDIYLALYAKKRGNLVISTGFPLL
jgi:hypothetical protein